MDDGFKTVKKTKQGDPKPQPHGPQAVQFPVILAAPKHNHFYYRDEADKWPATIKDINRGTYDELKLKRVSFYLPTASLHGSPMAFGYDGTLIVARDQNIKHADDATDAFNRVTASLLIGGVPLGPVSPRDLAFGVLSSTGYFRYQHAHGAAARIRQSLGEGDAGSSISIDLLDPPYVCRDTVLEAWGRGEPVLAALQGVSPEFLVMAFGYYRDDEYRSGLIYAWLVVEQLIGFVWAEMYLNQPGPTMFDERHGDLNRVARNVSGKVEFLMQAGLMDRKLYLHLRQARIARNDLIHQGVGPSRDNLYFCLRAVVRLIELVCSRAAISFDASALLKTIAKNRRREPTEQVMRAEDADWSRALYWREVKPIPGELHFRSKPSETVEYLALQPVHRRDTPKGS